MFQFNLKINDSYNVCYFFIGNKRFHVIYKKRVWLILKNRTKTFFSNFIFKLKFSKNNMRYRFMYKGNFKPKFKRFFKALSNKLKRAKNFFSHVIYNHIGLKQKLKKFKKEIKRLKK